jgi:hypothetical protein
MSAGGRGRAEAHPAPAPLTKFSGVVVGNHLRATARAVCPPLQGLVCVLPANPCRETFFYLFNYLSVFQGLEDRPTSTHPRTMHMIGMKKWGMMSFLMAEAAGFVTLGHVTRPGFVAPLLLRSVRRRGLIECGENGHSSLNE